MSYKNSLILIPSYQPEETLLVLSKGLFVEGFKIVIVDDGSGPTYQNIFNKCKEFATVIGYESNMGKGYALKYGFKYIIDNFNEYKGVITADGDGQHRILDIVSASEKLDSTNMSVIGDRSFDVNVPFKSKIGNDMSQFSQSLATYRYLHDNQCGLRAFLIKDLPELVRIGGNRYEYEMRVITHLQYKEIPYTTMRVETIYEDGNRTTHFRPILDTLLIQSSIMLSGLINIISYVLQAILAFIFLNFVFTSDLLIMKTELSIIVSFAISLIAHIVLLMIFYRPRYPQKTILRTILYQVLILVATFISVCLFTEFLGLHILLTYFISSILILLPLFYMIKGIGVVYESQHE